MSSKSPWPQEYYNALRFYYREPQRLNRHVNAKRQDRTCDQVIESLSRSEVPLNHLPSLFLSLAPAFLLGRCFEQHLQGWSTERLESRVGPTLDVAKSIGGGPAATTLGRPLRAAQAVAGHHGGA